MLRDALVGIRLIIPGLLFKNMYPLDARTDAGFNGKNLNSIPQRIWMIE